MDKCDNKDCFWFNVSVRPWQSRNYSNFETKYKFGIDYIPYGCDTCEHSLNHRVRRLQKEIEREKTKLERNYIKDSDSLDWLKAEFPNEPVVYLKDEFENCIHCGSNEQYAFRITSYYPKKKCHANIGMVCYDCLLKHKRTIKKFIKVLTNNKFAKWER